MKKIVVILLFIIVGLPSYSHGNGGHSGGAIAGGVLGGMALGALLASRPRRTEREVIVEKVYVDKYGNPITPANTGTHTSTTNGEIEEYDDYE